MAEPPMTSAVPTAAPMNALRGILGRFWRASGRELGVSRIGLTGGIASGKSTVGYRLRGRGIPVIDADELAREVVAPGTGGLRDIVEAFGPAILDATGALDRE